MISDKGLYTSIRSKVYFATGVRRRRNVPPLRHPFVRSSVCSLAVPDPGVGHIVDSSNNIGILGQKPEVLSQRRLGGKLTYFLRVYLFSVVLIDSSTKNPVHVLMLTVQAVRGLPRLRAPGIVPCIISFSRQLPSFLMV